MADPSIPELKQLVQQASQALALLDADRLEALALCCQVFNRELLPLSGQARIMLSRQSHEAQRDMALFARVLDATRDNIRVLRRLFELRQSLLQSGHLEYSAGGRWPAAPSNPD